MAIADADGLFEVDDADMEVADVAADAEFDDAAEVDAVVAPEDADDFELDSDFDEAAFSQDFEDDRTAVADEMDDSEAADSADVEDEEF